MNAKRQIPQEHDPAHASEDFVVGRMTVMRGQRVMPDADSGRKDGKELAS